MAADAQSSNWIDLQSINPDDLGDENQSYHRCAATNTANKPLPTWFYVELPASQLPGMLDKCSRKDNGFPSSMITNPDPMKLPSCMFYPIQSGTRSRLFCCKDYSKMPIHFLFKSVIECIYHSVLDTDFTFMELHSEVHKKLHRTMDGLQKILETTGLVKLYERVSLTISDGRAADVVIEHGLHADNNSFSTSAGEYSLSESLIKDAFSFKDTKDYVQFSEMQPVTRYFLGLIEKYSAVVPKDRICVEEIPGNESLFMIRTGLKNNRAYLPLVFCIGMIVSFPFAGRLSSKYWIFRKEVLYLLAKTFGILDLNMSGMLYSLLSNDVHRCSMQQQIYCRPLWRALISIERTYGETECLSHVPRTAVTMVKLTHFAELVVRLETLVRYEKEDIERERYRVLNLYENREKGRERDECITVVLMYERKHLIEQLPQFIPKLKSIHKRKRLVRWNEEDTSEDNEYGL